MTELLNSFGGHALNSRLFDFEAVADAPVADTGTAEPASASADTAGDGGQAAAPADVGAATDAPAATPAAAEPPAAIDWSSPDAQQALQQAIDAREQHVAEQARQAELAQERQSEFSDVEEALGLLGLTPDRIQAYFGRLNEPLANVAQRVQEQEQVAQVDGWLATLAPTHPDLLGDGVDKLADLKNEETGEPLFDVDAVKQDNKRATLYAAAAISTANPGIDHTVAVAEGAKAVAARDAIIGKVAVERFKRELAGTGTAPREPGTGGGEGAARVTGLEGGDEVAWANRWAKENGVR